jgi:hypothetical protein
VGKEEGKRLRLGNSMCRKEPVSSFNVVFENNRSKAAANQRA